MKCQCEDAIAAAADSHIEGAHVIMEEHLPVGGQSRDSRASVVRYLALAALLLWFCLHLERRYRQNLE